MGIIVNNLLGILFNVTLAYGQNDGIEDVHPALKEAVESLQDKGIDSLFVYHSYCVGCESRIKWSEKCEGFIDARVVWKKTGKTFSKQIICDSLNTKVEEANSEAFNYFINNYKVLTERKPLPKGHFYPPVYIHYYGEDFYLIINNKWLNTKLHKEQRGNKEWAKFSWVKPTIKLSDLNKLEVNRK